jgi:hypothetical protein
MVARMSSRLISLGFFMVSRSRFGCPAGVVSRAAVTERHMLWCMSSAPRTHNLRRDAWGCTLRTHADARSSCRNGRSVPGRSPVPSLSQAGATGARTCALGTRGSAMRAPTPGRLAGRRLYQAARLGLIPAELEASEPWRCIGAAVTRCMRRSAWGCCCHGTRGTRARRHGSRLPGGPSCGGSGWRWDKHGTPKGGGGSR